jgi:hypothetical protein
MERQSPQTKPKTVGTLQLRASGFAEKAALELLRSSEFVHEEHKREKQGLAPPIATVQGRKERLGLGAKFIPHTDNEITAQAKLKRAMKAPSRAQESSSSEDIPDSSEEESRVNAVQKRKSDSAVSSVPKKRK